MNQKLLSEVRLTTISIKDQLNTIILQLVINYVIIINFDLKIINNKTKKTNLISVGDQLITNYVIQCI